ncbi:MAG TPA: ATP-binding cassette domain-containing protein, partial [Acidimicrobiia bacterium]
MSTRFGINRSTAPLLVAEGLVKRYGGLTALAGVDLAIRAGELVGLVGPNGSGKTTLFDCLTGMTVLDEGRVSYEGADITRARPHR